MTTGQKQDYPRKTTIFVLRGKRARRGWIFLAVFRGHPSQRWPLEHLTLRGRIREKALEEDGRRRCLKKWQKEDKKNDGGHTILTVCLAGDEETKISFREWKDRLNQQSIFEVRVMLHVHFPCELDASCSSKRTWPAPVDAMPSFSVLWGFCQTGCHKEEDNEWWTNGKWQTCPELHRRRGLGWSPGTRWYGMTSGRLQSSWTSTICDLLFRLWWSQQQASKNSTFKTTQNWKTNPSSLPSETLTRETQQKVADDLLFLGQPPAETKCTRSRQSLVIQGRSAHHHAHVRALVLFLLVFSWHR